MSSSRTPATMQPSQSVAEMIHQDVNYVDLAIELAKLATPEEKLAFFAQKLRGAATLGLLEDFHQDGFLHERARDAVKTILTCDKGSDKTGVQLGLNRLPSMLVTDPLLSVLPSSSVLTYKDILQVKENTRAHGDCTISILCQPSRRPKGECTGFHTEIVVQFHSEEDGEPIMLSTVLVPLKEVHQETIRKVIEAERLGPVDLDSDLSRAWSSPEGHQALGPENMLLVLRRSDMAAALAEFTPLNKVPEAPIKPFQDLRFVTHPTELVFSFKGTLEDAGFFLQMEQLQQLSLARGETLTFGNHYGFASCETYDTIILKTLFPRRFADIDPAFVPLKDLTRFLAKEADRLYKAKIKDARVYHFIDDNERTEAFEDVTTNRKIVFDHAKSIFDDEHLNLQLSSAFPSWNNWFNNPLAVPLEPTPRGLYQAAADAAVSILEEKADHLSGAEPFGLGDVEEAIGRTEQLVEEFKGSKNEWAALFKPDPTVDAFMEKMRGYDPRAFIDEMSFADLERDTAFLARNQASEKWSEGLEQLRRLADFHIGLRPHIHKSTAVASLQQKLNVYLERRHASKGRAPATDDQQLELSISNLRLGDDSQGEEEDHEEAERLAAFELIGIMIDQNPTRATEIKAHALTVLASALTVAFALQFFWLVIRYAFSKDGGVTVSPGQNAVAVASYTLAQPAWDTMVQYTAMKLGGFSAAKKPLPYPVRFAQEQGHALLGGPLIGFLAKFINSIPHSSELGGRLAWEFLAVIPGILSVTAAKLLLDIRIFKQKYEVRRVTDPARIAFWQSLKKAIRDFTSFEHWVKVRLVTFGALYAHEWTQRHWYYLFQKLQPYNRSFVGAAQFGTFFVSFVTLTQISEKVYEMSKEQLQKRARRLANREDTEAQRSE